MIHWMYTGIQAVFLYCCQDLFKLPSQCYSNRPGKLDTLGSSKDMRPHEELDIPVEESHFIRNLVCFSLLLPRLSNQCYSDHLGNFVNLGRDKEIQPEVIYSGCVFTKKHSGLFQRRKPFFFLQFI